MKETKVKKWWRIFKISKYIESNYEADKKNIIVKYNEKGYRDGATNVKMYFSIKNTLPSVQWIDSQSGNHLNSRLKMDAALKEEE